jgi:hypothetical protein
MIKQPNNVMVTAGGKIACRRCKASSVRNKEQCGRPALKGMQVCQFHGGKSTGPKSEESKQRLRTLNIKDGLYTLESRLASSQLRLKLRYIEYVGHHLGMIKEKTRGRKPKGWIALNPNIPSEYERMLRFAGLIN